VKRSPTWSSGLNSRSEWLEQFCTTCQQPNTALRRLAGTRGRQTNDPNPAASPSHCLRPFSKNVSAALIAETWKRRGRSGIAIILMSLTWSAPSCTRSMAPSHGAACGQAAAELSSSSSCQGTHSRPSPLLTDATRSFHSSAPLNREIQEGLRNLVPRRVALLWSAWQVESLPLRA
jgi:hypothetical protein